MTTNNVLIVGAGDVGGNLAAALVADGYNVWGIRRSNRAIAEGVHLIQGDITDLENFPTLPQQVDYLVYAVASSEFTEKGYQKNYVAGLNNVLNHLLVQGSEPKHSFFVSSTSVYHQHEGEWIDETSATEPQGFSGQKMLAAEQVLLGSPFAGSVVRFSGIYGPGRQQLINQARQGGHCDPEPPVWTNRIHRDDCVGVLKFLIDQAAAGKTLQPIYLASDQQPVTLFDMLEWLKERMAIVVDDEDVPEVTRRANKRCDSALLQKSGYKFKYPNYQLGYEAILTEMGL